MARWTEAWEEKDRDYELDIEMRSSTGGGKKEEWRARGIGAEESKRGM